jgi:hypothetical protein
MHATLHLESQGVQRRRCLQLLIFALGSLAMTISLQAASLAGVTLPDTVRIGSTTLVLNGLGLRTKFAVKVYVAGLYVVHKSSDGSAIVKEDAPKQMVLHFVRSVSQAQMADAFDHAIDDNTPDAKKTMKSDIDRFLEALEPVKEGDQMVFTYVPGSGTTLTINQRDKFTIPGSSLSQVLFSIWLGPKPPNEGLQKGILGK